MAKGRTYRRRKGKKPVVVGYRKRIYKKRNREIVMYKPIYGGAPLPSVYKTKFVMSGYGSTTSGGSSGDYYWLVKLNSIYQPFGYVGAFSGMTFLDLPLTSNPIGFGQLLSTNMYQFFRVESSQIIIHVNPQSILDTAECIVTPTSNSSNPGSVSAALTQKYSVGGIFSNGKDVIIVNPQGTTRNTKKRYLTNYIRVNQLFGVTQDAIKNDLSGRFTGTYNSDPPACPFWRINLETADNTELNQALEVRINVVYYVTLWGLSNANMPR